MISLTDTCSTMSEVKVDEANADEDGFQGLSLPKSGADDLLKAEAETQAMNDIANIMRRTQGVKEKLSTTTFAPRMAQWASGAAAPPATAPPPVFAAINAKNKEQVIGHIEEALAAGACGIFLVNNNFDYPQLLPIVRSVRAQMPTVFLGVNFSMMSGSDSFPILGRLAREGVKVDAFWADNACMEHEMQAQPVADNIKAARDAAGWDGLYFGGVAVRNPKNNVKLCKAVPAEKLKDVATSSVGYMDVVATSGPEGAVAPDESKVANMREGCGTTPLCLATTGMTAEDLRALKGQVDAFILQMDDAQTTPELDVDMLKLLVQGC
mmetsp:Transcript_52695/g.120234  ORF Transcript_52695/g.120234 Transcript_52695/m.120234 type:complete len:324 (+) Transcript_52695:3-974(+)